MVGSCLAQGKGVKQNEKEAVVWYTKAAEQGMPLAQTSLGICYYLGNGVRSDKAKAKEWFKKASDQGYTAAKRLLDQYYNQ